MNQLFCGQIGRQGQRAENLFYAQPNQTNLHVKSTPNLLHIFFINREARWLLPLEVEVEVAVAAVHQLTPFAETRLTQCLQTNEKSSPPREILSK